MFLGFLNFWQLIGIILILACVILLIAFPEYQFVLIIFKLIETMGIALMIGAVLIYQKRITSFKKLSQSF